MALTKDRQGLTVVVTGASSGFGRGISQKLAADGANVVLAAILSQHLMPRGTEKLNGALLQEMLNSAPFAEKTSGSIHSPRSEGAEVSGNMRNRLKQQIRKGK